MSNLNLVSVSTRSLSGRALAFAVARAGDWHTSGAGGGTISPEDALSIVLDDEIAYDPAAHWERLLERKGISVYQMGHQWMAGDGSGLAPVFADRPSVAGLRCYVLKALGEQVEVPRELLSDAPGERAGQPVSERDSEFVPIPSVSVPVSVSQAAGNTLDWMVIYALTLEANEGRVVHARDLADIALRNGHFRWTSAAGLGILLRRRKVDIKWSPSQTECFATISVLWPRELPRDELRSVCRHGPNAAVAACRALVASIAGDEIHVPQRVRDLDVHEAAQQAQASGQSQGDDQDSCEMSERPRA